MEVAVHLTLTGEALNLEALSRALGLTATKTWKQGDPITHAMCHKEDGWRFSLPPVSTLNLSAALQPLLAIIAPLAPRLRGLLSTPNITGEIAIHVEHHADESYPTIHFSPETFGTLHDLGLELDIDIIGFASQSL